MKITELDHIVLNVKDIDRSLAFYTGVLGLDPERVDEFRRGEVGFPSVRINQHAVIDLSPSKDPSDRKDGSPRNLNHFCLVVEDEDLPALVNHLKDRHVEIHQGPVSRWGARGRATSIYFRDPDGNEIEIRKY
jgi:catechol 2,3-dioxygenase-like lactoylglutathione lyase family enzyme